MLSAQHFCMICSFANGSVHESRQNNLRSLSIASVILIIFRMYTLRTLGAVNLFFHLLCIISIKFCLFKKARIHFIAARVY